MPIHRGRIALDYLAITAGVILSAAGVCFFRIPNGFSIGGVSGLSILLSKLSGGRVSAGTLLLAVNALLLLIGMLVLGRSFGLRTAYGSLLFSAAVWVGERLLPLEASLSGDPLLDLVYDILLVGCGSVILFAHSASTGGTDVIMMIVRKYTSVPFGTALLAADALIAFSSFAVYGVRIGLYSVLGLFLKAFVVDSVVESINLCKCFMIVTSHPAEIRTYVLEKMRHGVTELRASGGYTSEGREMLVTVCRRTEAIRLKRAVRQIDSTAFTIITNSSEIIGRGFRGIV